MNFSPPGLLYMTTLIGHADYTALLTLRTDDMKEKNLDLLLGNLFKESHFNVSDFKTNHFKLLTLATLIYARIFKEQPTQGRLKITAEFRPEELIEREGIYLSRNFYPLTHVEISILSKYIKPENNSPSLVIHPFKKGTYSQKWVNSLIGYIRNLDEDDNYGLQELDGHQFTIFTLEDSIAEILTV